MAHTGGQDAFLPVVLHLHRLSRHPGQHCRHRLHCHLQLASKGSADGRGHHPYLVIRQAEDTGHNDTEGKGILAWAVYGQLSGRIKVSYGYVRFNGSMVDGLGGVAVLKYIIALLKSLLHIACLCPGYAHDVASLMNRVGFGLYGFLHIGNHRQGFVLHLNQVYCPFGNIQGLCCHGSHPVPHKTNGIVKDTLRVRKIVLNEADRAVVAHLGRILIGGHCPHPRQGLGRGGVDALDSGMGHRAQEHLCVEHSGQFHITYIYFLSRYLQGSVAYGSWFSDYTVFILHPVFLPSGWQPVKWPSRYCHTRCSGRD